MQRPLGNLVRNSKSSLLVAPWLFLLALVLAGCDEPSTTGPANGGPPDAGPKACVPGELTRDDGSCQKAGLPPDMPCPPGKLLDDGTTCQKAGVAPSACGVGFLPDGKDGCEPILPTKPCQPGVGKMAVPGDAACHEVSPCGSGTWGDIPVEANTQFVDKMYVGANNDGTQAHPWTTIQKGISSAAKGAIVAVAEGTYPEDLLIQGKRVRLWGRCPAMVKVVGAGVQFGAIEIVKTAANASEIHGVAVTGAKAGIYVSSSKDVVIEGVQIHETGSVGFAIQDDSGASSVLLKGSLVEQSHGFGVFVGGSHATIEATAIRATLSDAQGFYGRGINIRDYKKTRADVAVRGCLVEQNHEHGIFVGNSDATIEATVVRSTMPDAQGQSGRGIGIEDGPAKKERANVTIRACLVEQNHEHGVFVGGSDVTIEATVVRSTLPDALGEGSGITVVDDSVTKERANVTIRASLAEQNHGTGVFVEASDATIEATVVRSSVPDAQGKVGRGIGIQDNIKTKVRANVTVRACLVEQNHESGVFVGGSDATIEATVVRSTLANALGKGGRGIDVEGDHSTMARANVTVRACLVEQNRELGVFVVGSDATIEATVIRSALSDGQGIGGRGIEIDDDSETMARANVTVRACLVEQNHESGVFVEGSDATIEATVVCSTLPDAHGDGGRGINIQDDDAGKERANVTIRACFVEQNQDVGVFVFGSDARIETSAVRNTKAKAGGTFGDGIAVFEGTATLQDVEVTHNARAGISNFGGHVVVTGGVISCNDVDLDGEPFNNTPFSFDDSSGWQCSLPPHAECTELTSECLAQTTGLEAPTKLPPVDPIKDPSKP